MSTQPPAWTALRQALLEHLEAAGPAGADISPLYSSAWSECRHVGWCQYTFDARPVGTYQGRLTPAGLEQLQRWRDEGGTRMAAAALARAVVVLTEQRETVYRSAVNVKTGQVTDLDMRAWLEQIDHAISLARSALQSLQVQARGRLTP